MLITIEQAAKFPIARSPLATKYFSLATGIWHFICLPYWFFRFITLNSYITTKPPVYFQFFSYIKCVREKWRPNLIWLLDTDLQFQALL
jgi:hypothetical protein